MRWQMEQRWAEGLAFDNGSQVHAGTAESTAGCWKKKKNCRSRLPINSLCHFLLSLIVKVGVQYIHKSHL